MEKTIICQTENFKVLLESVFSAAIIRVFDQGESIIIGEVLDFGHKCIFKSNGANIQNYIISWDLFVEFVRCLDESFDYFNLKGDK